MYIFDAIKQEYPDHLIPGRYTQILFVSIQIRAPTFTNFIRKNCGQCKRPEDVGIIDENEHYVNQNAISDQMEGRNDVEMLSGKNSEDRHQNPQQKKAKSSNHREKFLMMRASKWSSALKNQVEMEIKITTTIQIAIAITITTNKKKQKKRKSRFNPPKHVLGCKIIEQQKQNHQSNKNKEEKGKKGTSLPRHIFNTDSLNL